MRNALATLAIAALEEDDARDALVWLADPTGPVPPAAAHRLTDVQLIEPAGSSLLPIHATHTDNVRAHATRAVRAATAHRAHTHRADGPLERAVVHAVALWNAGLFFEVHEVLEDVWKTATGDTRQALQGVIQVAVAYHHLAHGNARGARSLLREGRARLDALAASALPSLDLAAFSAATAPWETALTRGTPLPAGGQPPVLVGR